MHAHFVLAHPEPNSFNAHLVHSGAQTLIVEGWTTTISDNQILERRGATARFSTPTKKHDMVRTMAYLRNFILKRLPSFCWQTASEIVPMLEQEMEDISISSVTMTLAQLAEMGIIERRRIKTPIVHKPPGRAALAEYKARELPLQ